MEIQAEILQDPYLPRKYEFIQKLGQGCFGKIYKVRNRQLKMFTALKLETLDANNRKSLLFNEVGILKTLKGKPFVPEFYSAGKWSSGAYIEIELMVKDLSSLVEKVFSYDEICSLTAKLLHSLSVLHNANILHQDIKPQNIMRNTKGEYVFIDFGISKKIKENQSKPDAQNKKQKGFIGTPRYASIQAHMGFQQSKKDDLQSLMYNIAFLYFKKLPWLSLKVAGNKKIEEIKNTKIKTAEVVFQQMGKAFNLAFDYIKKLQDNEEPNYKELISIFKRGYTVIVDPIKNPNSVTRLDSAEKMGLRRSQAKKMTLNPNENYGKYLELPFMTKEGIHQRNMSTDKSPRERSIFSTLISSTNNSMSGTKAISMWAYNEIDEITNDDQPDQQKEMNLKEEEGQEPSVGNISKFFGALTMKNPFVAQN